MSATALAFRRPVPRVRLRWSQSVGAVVGGLLFGYVLALVWAVPLGLLRLLPLFSPRGPLRPWLAVADRRSVERRGGRRTTASRGAVVAYGIELVTFRWTAVSPRRLPFVLVAATLGWLPFSVGESGVVGAGGAVAFFAMVWLTRNYSRSKGTPLQWTRGRALAAIAGCSRRPRRRCRSA